VISSARAWVVFHAVVLLVALLPAIGVADLPMIDLPNHIARMLVARELPQTPILQQFYTYHWAFVPNLAFDGFVSAVGRLVGVFLAAKLFILAAMTLLYVGTVWLHWVWHGRFSLVPTAAVVLMYNGALLFGFANYIMGVGLSLCATAAWIAAREMKLCLIAPLFAVIGLVLMSVHLFAFGLFGLAALGIELDRIIEGWRRARAFPGPQAARTLVVGLATAVPSLLLLYAISPTVSGLDRNVASTPLWKAEALSAPLLFYFTAPEIVVAAAFVTVFIVTVLLRIIVVNRHSLIALGLLILAFLAMPRTLVSSGYADYRMPSAIAFFALAALDWSDRANPLAVFSTCLTLLFIGAGKVIVIGAMWLAWQPALAAYAAAFQRLPPGAVLLTIDGSTGSTSGDRQPPIVHMPSLAAARGVLVPTLFGDEPGFLLSIAPRYRDLRHLVFGAGPDADAHLMRFASRYTHLLVNRPERVTLPAGLTYEPIASGPTFILYRLGPPRAPRGE
jgi:hypothetical protein